MSMITPPPPIFQAMKVRSAWF